MRYITEEGIDHILRRLRDGNQHATDMLNEKRGDEQYHHGKRFAYNDAISLVEASIKSGPAYVDTEMMCPLFSDQGVPTKRGKAVNELMQSLHREMNENMRWISLLKEEQSEKPGSLHRQEHVRGMLHALGALVPSYASIIRRYEDAIASERPPAMRPEDV